MSTHIVTHMNTKTHETYECFALLVTKIASSTKRTNMKMKIKYNNIYDMKIKTKINHEGGDIDNPSLIMN